jgi:hypothetical protein
MRVWRRPYRVPREIVLRERGAAALALAALALVIAFGASGHIDDVRAGIAMAVALIAAAYAARMRVVGVFVNDSGVLVRAFDGSVELPWRSVAWIDVHPSDARAATPSPALAIWISTVDGERIETPLIRRRAGMTTSSVVVVHLPTADFDRTLRELRMRSSADG